MTDSYGKLLLDSARRAIFDYRRAGQDYKDEIARLKEANEVQSQMIVKLKNAGKKLQDENNKLSSQIAALSRAE